jgi:hypothetical protein
LALTYRGAQQLTLVGLQGEYPLLNGIPSHEPVDQDRIYLADAIRPVRRLVLNGWIPPRIEDVDMVRCREIESNPAGLQREEKHVGTIRALKIPHDGVTIDGRTIDPTERDAALS